MWEPLPPMVKRGFPSLPLAQEKQRSSPISHRTVCLYQRRTCTCQNLYSLVCRPCHPVNLLPESISVLEHNGCSACGEQIDIEHLRWIVHLPEVLTSGAFPTGELFFLTRYEKENTYELLAGGEALQRLMQNLLTVRSGGDQLSSAKKLAQHCCKLHFSELAYVYDLIKKETNL